MCVSVCVSVSVCCNNMCAVLRNESIFVRGVGIGGWVERDCVQIILIQKATVASFTVNIARCVY